MPITTESTPAQKLQSLRQLLRGYNRVLVAYSGGVDSAFLLKVAQEELNERAVAVIGISPSLLPEELDGARQLARQLGTPLREVSTQEINDPNYNSNPSNRCYFCKSELFGVLSRIADEENFDVVCDGTNLDDLQEWRPGAQAATENRVLSPLREAKLTKAEIRELSRNMNLPTWDKPAMPCLASRIPYGTPVTPEALQMIGRGEVWLRERGFAEVRVRHYVEDEKPVARIEVAPADMPQLFALRDELTQHLRAQGYQRVLLDLEGYRRGKLNDNLPSAPQPVQLFLKPKKKAEG